MITSAEVEDLRTMYSQWVEMTYDGSANSAAKLTEEEAGLQLRCHDVLTKLMEQSERDSKA